MDILELLKKPESKTLEFKRDLSSARGILRTIVAFANTVRVLMEEPIFALVQLTALQFYFSMG